MTPRHTLGVLALAAFGLILTLSFLGASALWDPWEPKYAQTAREMEQTGDWIVPHHREDPRLVKPPLTYWMIAASHALFGVNETAARFPSALLAVLCPVGLALALAFRGRALAGWVAGIALLTSPQWLLIGRFATPDMPLASILGLLLAIAIAWPGLRSPTSRRLATVGVVVLLAAAVMTDGARGLLIPAWSVAAWSVFRTGRRGAAAMILIAVLYLVGQHRYSVSLNLAAAVSALLVASRALSKCGAVTGRAIGLGSAGVLALVVPWYVAAYVLEPGHMLDGLFGYKHGLNLGEGIGEKLAPAYYVPWIVAVGSLPWIGAAVSGLLQAIRRRFDEPEATVAGAAVGTTLFFALSEAKMGHFYGVIQPAVAVLAGLALVTLARKCDWTIWPGLLVLGATIVAVMREPRALLEPATVFTALYGRIDSGPWVVACVTFWLCVVTMALLTHRSQALPIAGLAAALLSGYLAIHSVPVLGPLKSFGPMWRQYREIAPEGASLVAYGWTQQSAFYYSDNAAVRLKTPQSMREFLARDDSVFVIAPHDSRPGLDWALEPGARWRVVDDDHPYHMLLEYLPAYDLGR